MMGLITAAGKNSAVDKQQDKRAQTVRLLKE